MAVSPYKAVKVAWRQSNWGIALITWTEQGGFPQQGGRIALYTTPPPLLGGPLLCYQAGFSPLGEGAFYTNFHVMAPGFHVNLSLHFLLSSFLLGVLCRWMRPPPREC